MSASTRSLPRAAARCTASNTMAEGSPPSAPLTISVPVRSAHMASWSAAAARNVSPAARRTEWPSAVWRRASLPIVVVLPTPFTPTMSQTSGAPSLPSKRSARVSAVSSSSRMDWPSAASRSSPLRTSLDSTLARSSAEQRVGRGDADVGPDERLFERVPRCLRRCGRPGARPPRRRTGHARHRGGCDRSQRGLRARRRRLEARPAPRPRPRPVAAGAGAGACRCWSVGFVGGRVGGAVGGASVVGPAAPRPRRRDRATETDPAAAANTITTTAMMMYVPTIEASSTPVMSATLTPSRRRRLRLLVLRDPLAHDL